MSGRVAQASVPGLVDLTGGSLGRWPPPPGRAGVSRVAVAIDRRASCRVEAGAVGVQLHSRHTLEKVEGRSVSELRARGVLALVAGVLRWSGVEAGVQVEVQSRLPGGGGLGASSALAVGVAAAVARAFRQDEGFERLAAIAREAEAEWLGAPCGIPGHLAALHGGVVGVRVEQGVAVAERLGVDPAVLEESLLLVDSGSRQACGEAEGEPRASQGDRQVEQALAEIAGVSAELRLALEEGRFDEVAGLLAREWQARKRLDAGVTTPEVDRVVAAATAAGGAGVACGSGGGGMVAIWARPGLRDGGARSRALAALREAGFRSVPFRVDLRGLELE